jgi:rhodanese-related sulfurtransferase
MVAVIAGAAHSWVVPVKVALSTIAPPAAVDHNQSAHQSAGTPPSDGTAAPVNPDALGHMISLAEARALYETGALFLDTRTKEQYDKGHILGAFHLATVEFDAGQTGEIFAMLSPKTHYVLYCDGGDCDASENVAQRLEDAFPLFHIMKDGFPAWEQAGYDVEVPEGGNP